MRHPKASDVFEAPAVIVRGPGIKAYNDAGNSKNGTLTFSEKRPHRSKALSCHPDQADRMTSLARKAGIRGVAYDRKTGEMVATSKKGHDAEAKRRGEFYNAENTE